MDNQQRFLRRLWLLNNLPLLLRETEYHRRHEDDEGIKGYTLASIMRDHSVVAKGYEVL